MKKPSLKDRNDSILWARNVLENKQDYLIMDTETSGLDDDDEIIQIAIIDLDENVLYNTLIKPKAKKSISRDSTLIHGLSKKDLKEAPFFETEISKFINVINDKTILMYNAEFDARMLQQTCYANNCEKFKLSYWCVMKEYSKFVGEWNDYHNDYRYQKLSGGDHTALGDCKATLRVLKKMAKSDLVKLDTENEASVMMEKTDTRDDEFSSKTIKKVLIIVLIIIIIAIFFMIS